MTDHSKSTTLHLKVISPAQMTTIARRRIDGYLLRLIYKEGYFRFECFQKLGIAFAKFKRAGFTLAFFTLLQFIETQGKKEKEKKERKKTLLF